jgi:phage tail-like protein
MGRFPPSVGVPLAAACLMVSIIASPAAGDNIAADTAPPLLVRVMWDGHVIPGITKVTGLVRRTEVIAPRSGGDPSSYRLSPGATSYEPIILERHLGQDAEFERWADKVWSFGSGLGSEVSLRDFRKDIIIDLLDEMGQKVLSYRIYRCWPSDYVVLGDMDAERPSAPIETLVLQYEGWERDHELAPPH